MGSAGADVTGGSSTGGAGSTLDVTTGGAEVSEEDGGAGFVGSASPGGCSGGSLRPVAGGFAEIVVRTVSVTVDTATLVWVASRAALSSRACPSITTVSVTVAVVNASNGSVHHCDVGRDGGGAACGASSGDPVSAINTNMPPSARNGTTTTAPKQPRPLRGSSR